MTPHTDRQYEEGLAGPHEHILIRTLHSYVTEDPHAITRVRHLDVPPGL